MARRAAAPLAPAQAGGRTLLRVPENVRPRFAERALMAVDSLSVWIWR